MNRNHLPQTIAFRGTLMLAVLLLGCTQTNAPISTTATPTPTITLAPTPTPIATALATSTPQATPRSTTKPNATSITSNQTINVTANASTNASANVTRPDFKNWVQSVNAYAKRAFNASQPLREMVPEVWFTSIIGSGSQDYELTVTKARTHWTSQDALETVFGVNGTENKAYLTRAEQEYAWDINAKVAYVFTATLKCYKQFYEIQFKMTDRETNTTGKYKVVQFDTKRGDRVLPQLIDACPP